MEVANQGQGEEEGCNQNLSLELVIEFTCAMIIMR
jgi:hypothetical protein